MADLKGLRRDIEEEVSTILGPAFSIGVTETRLVPHSSDGAITFPNLDQKTQGTKIIETTVLYVDMRRSTALSLKHKQKTVAKLYSAFVRGMTRCAGVYGGEVRGIIGDRVMMLFDKENCFTNAVDTAHLINSVCTHIINKHFSHNEVTFGIGIDYGSMLATKTGIRRHGAAQQSYRSLVWLGRPANVASKLTDQANKPEETTELVKLNVAYGHWWNRTYAEEWPHEFAQNFTYDIARNLMVHHNPAFHSFTSVKKRHVMRIKTPAILMSKKVYDGYRAARPNSDEIKNGWYKKIDVAIPDYTGEVYGGDVFFSAFKAP